ncbi:M24 family metallopeptidase [Paraburkholderia caffeinilytica]|uniref:M24 family metallopeptidase n=1 Tax=Paraburkholderia caffeinilytica TaxID=1761016 RepID=UPI003DA085F0
MSALLRDERSARLRHAMEDAGLDLLVIAGNAWRSDYLRYALDVTPMEGQAVACIARQGASRLIVDNPVEAARIAAEQTTLQVSWSSAPLADVEEWLASSGTRRVGLASAHASPQRLARGPLGATVAATTAWFDRLMVNKSPAEAEAVGRAVVLADAGYQVFCAASRVGRTEYELIADIESWFRAQGCPENFVILGSGGQEVRGMHPPGERRLAVGDLVTTELTPCVDGYYAQLCRTLVIGPPSGAQLRAFAVYLEALEAGIAAVRPGATHGEIAYAQNEVFRRHGLGDYVTSAYTRVRGHGLGLFVDGPHVLENVNLVLEPDMTLIVHPNTYHPEVGYMVLGDTVRVTPQGCEVLTATPRELISVPA